MNSAIQMVKNQQFKTTQTNLRPSDYARGLKMFANAEL